MTEMGAWFHWASLGVGAAGLIASIVGLIFAFLARRAAKSAEAAAERASEETRRAVSRGRRTVEAGRAIALINRLKVLHRDGDWEYALELYPELRGVLSEIQASMPTQLDEYQEKINEAVPQVTTMEDQVSRALYESTQLEDAPELSTILNAIQQDLETLQTNVIYPDNLGGN